MLWSRPKLRFWLSVCSGLEPPWMYKCYLLYCYYSVLFNWCLKDKNTQKDVTEKGCPSLMYKRFNLSLCTRFIVMWLLCGFIRVEICDVRVVLVSWAWRSLISQCRKWLRHMTDESAEPGYRHSKLSWDYCEKQCATYNSRVLVIHFQISLYLPRGKGCPLSKCTYVGSHSPFYCIF